MSLRGVLALVVQLAALSPALATAHSTPSPAPAQLELTDGRSYYPVTEARMLVDQERLLSVEQVRRLEGKANAWSTTRRFNFGYCELKHKTLLPTECPCRNWKAAAAGH